MCEQRYELLEFLLPNLESLLKDPPAQVLLRFTTWYDIYKAQRKDWKDSHSGAKVCKINAFCVWLYLICIFFFFFQESNDQHLWSTICCAVIEGNSAVFKECMVSGETLPHSDIDVVAGRIDNSGKSFGVQLLAENEVFQLQSPIGVSAKTQRTLVPHLVNPFA